MTTQNSDLLSVTAFFSVVFHAGVILGISFKMPDIAAVSNTDNHLEVVLVTSKNNQKVEEAELISSADNAGGGNDDREGSTPLPYKAVTPSPIQSVDKTAQKVFQTEISPDQFLLADSGELQLKRPDPIKTKLKKEGDQSGE